MAKSFETSEILLMFSALSSAEKNENLVVVSKEIVKLSLNGV
jgi:hypothetical protein